MKGPGILLEYYFSSLPFPTRYNTLLIGIISKNEKKHLK